MFQFGEYRAKLGNIVWEPCAVKGPARRASSWSSTAGNERMDTLRQKKSATPNPKGQSVPVKDPDLDMQEKLNIAS